MQWLQRAGAMCRTTNAVLVTLQRGLLFFLMSLLTAAMCAEIVSRYFFETSLFGLEQFIGYSAVWVYFVGAAYGSYERSHIRAEFVTVLVKGRMSRRGLWSFSAVISAMVSGVFTYYSFVFCRETIRMHETSPTHGVPMIYFHSALFVGGLLMTLYFVVEAFEWLRREAGTEGGSRQPSEGRL